LRAFGLAVIGAEYVLGWLPRGTHDWSKFVTPEEMRRGLAAANLETREITGVSYNPLADSWSLSRDTGVNYMALAAKPPLR
jgi:2-polyprenyl-6-hydroxyphenyl methylase/3-demethylubiquinone-9 3-methyltransferase